MKSMTGYGKAQAPTSIGNVTVELTSVNHRNLDIRLKLPEICRFIEIEARKALKSRVRRGYVEGIVRIEKDPVATSGNPRLNLHVAQTYFEEAKRFYQSLCISEPPEPTWILNRPDVWEATEDLEDNKIKEAVLPVFREALGYLIRSREEEGRALLTFFEQKLNGMMPLLNRLETLKSNVPQLAREALLKRLKELDLDPVLSSDRLAQEVLYTAQRADIAEEVSRLSSHVASFKTKLREEMVSGRELDFIVQEMNREVNTIGSKSISYDISTLTIQLKGTINQMREQIQNVE